MPKKPKEKKTEEERIRIDLKFLKEMHIYSQELLDGGYDRVKVEHLNIMTEDWIYELKDKILEITMFKPKEKKIGRRSACCNAEVDCRGGGYIGEDIAPIEDFCKKCGQTLAVNGIEKWKIFNPKTGKEIKGKKIK